MQNFGSVVSGLVFAAAAAWSPGWGAYGQEGAAGRLAPDADAIARVASGGVREARASWWGFDPEDATAALQAAIDSGVPKLTVDRMPGPWVVTPIRLVSNQEIVFESGVEVLAKEGAFLGTNESLFAATNVENITLTGPGATLRMRRSDYADPERYRKAEWRHCLSIRSSRGIKVFGLTLAESGGDGVYLGTATKGVTNRDIHIRDVVCDRNYRQGISVITAENLLIENTVLKDTDGTAPRAGIDFEPNHPEERLVNCVLRHCVSEGNGGAGYTFYVRPLRFESEPLSVRLENCRASGNRGAAFAFTTGDTLEGAVDGQVELVDCVFASGTGPCFSVAKPAERCGIRAVRCEFLDQAPEAPQPAPIVLSSRQDADAPAGGVHFVDCVVRDAVERYPMMYVDRGGGIPLSGIEGTLVLVRGGERSTVALSKEVLARWVPITAMTLYPRLEIGGMGLRPLGEATPEQCAFAFAQVRREGRFLLFARAGERVRLRAAHAQVGHYDGRPAPVVITAAAGKEAARGEVPFQGEAEIAFTAPETGVYRVQADPDRNRLAFVASTHPLNLAGEKGPIRLIRAAGTYYFHVPAGTEAFGVRISGEGVGEAIRATLLNPRGETVHDADDAVQTQQFEVILPEPSRGETWSLRLSRPGTMAWEDHSVDLRGIPPLLAPSPEALLVPAGGR
ncbi:MAG: right-handed parallel beta-helix repeat-containing protein [Lentisphaeria bacterium]|nr:right-handed parallel beta-helix repeat-containing protein [Lentisphaeria bacterium]